MSSEKSVHKPLPSCCLSLKIQFMHHFWEKGVKTDSSSLGCLDVFPCVSDSGCSSLTVLFEEGRIQSLHYPEDYSDMADCNWVFQAPKHYLIKVLTLVTPTLLWYLHQIA